MAVQGGMARRRRLHTRIRPQRRRGAECGPGPSACRATAQMGTCLGCCCRRRGSIGGVDGVAGQPSVPGGAKVPCTQVRSRLKGQQGLDCLRDMAAGVVKGQAHTHGLRPMDLAAPDLRRYDEWGPGVCMATRHWVRG